MERANELETPRQDSGVVRLVSPNVRLKALDGIRAVAISLVIAAHALNTVSNAKAKHIMLADGVSIFFVLSGFLITSLLLREHDTFGRVNLKEFYIRRVRRIIPAFYVFLVVIGILGLVKVIHFATTDWLSAFAFVNNYATTRSWWLGHTWSLCNEEQFYLLWPFVIAAGGRLWGIRIALAIIALDPLIRIASYFKTPALRDHLPIMLHTRLDILMFGCIVALLIGNPHFEAAMRLVLRFRLHIVFCLFYFFADPILNGRYGGSYYLTVGYTIDGVSLATMLYWIILRPEAPVVRMLSRPPVVFVGLISYSLYLWQQPFLAQVNTSFMGAFPINIAFAMLTAVASYFLIERPFLNRRQAVAPFPSTMLGTATT